MSRLPTCPQHLHSVNATPVLPMTPIAQKRYSQCSNWPAITGASYAPNRLPSLAGVSITRTGLGAVRLPPGIHLLAISHLGTVISAIVSPNNLLEVHPPNKRWTLPECRSAFFFGLRDQRSTELG